MNCRQAWKRLPFSSWMELAMLMVSNTWSVHLSDFVLLASRLLLALIFVHEGGSWPCISMAR